MYTSHGKAHPSIGPEFRPNQRLVAFEGLYRSHMVSADARGTHNTHCLAGAIPDTACVHTTPHQPQCTHIACIPRGAACHEGYQGKLQTPWLLSAPDHPDQNTTPLSAAQCAPYNHYPLATTSPPVSHTIRSAKQLCNASRMRELHSSNGGKEMIISLVLGRTAGERKGEGTAHQGTYPSSIPTPCC